MFSLHSSYWRLSIIGGKKPYCFWFCFNFLEVILESSTKNISQIFQLWICFKRPLLPVPAHCICKSQIIHFSSFSIFFLFLNIHWAMLFRIISDFIFSKVMFKPPSYIRNKSFNRNQKKCNLRKTQG